MDFRVVCIHEHDDNEIDRIVEVKVEFGSLAALVAEFNIKNPDVVLPEVLRLTGEDSNSVYTIDGSTISYNKAADSYSFQCGTAAVMYVPAAKIRGRFREICREFGDS